MNAPIHLQLDVGDPSLYVVNPDESTPLAITATNNLDEVVQGKLIVEIESYDGSKITIRDNLKLNPAETGSVSIPRERLGEPGIKWVHAKINPSGNSNGEPIVKKEMAFAYMRPAGNKDARNQEMLLGIAYGAGPDNESELAAKAASRVGIGIYRAPMWWNSPNPDFDNHFQKVRVHRKHGVEPYLLVTRTASFAQLPIDGEKGSNHPPKPEAWRTWIRQLAQAIREELPEDQDVYWELWNEPDIGFFAGTTDQYLEMLDIAHQEIERVDSENFHVMTGGFASLTHPHRKKDMAKRVITEGKDNWELVAYHEHGDFPKFVNGIENHLLPLLSKVDKPSPVFLTETGMDTRFGQHFQARELIKKIVYSWNQGFRAYTWFNLHDMRRAEHPRDPGFTYGLYTKLERVGENNEAIEEYWDYQNTYPKASYVALNTLSEVMTGFKRQERLELPEGQHAYTFKNEDRQLIITWDQNQKSASHLRLIPTDADRAEQVNIMGNDKEVTVSNGYAALEIGPTPSFMVLHGTNKGVAKGPALASTSKKSGETSSVVFYNPFDGPIDVFYQWKPASVFRLPDGTSAKGNLTIQPGEQREVSTAMEIKGGQSFSHGSTFINQLNYEIGVFGFNGSMEVPHEVNAISVPFQNKEWAELALEEQKQVVNRFEHDPHTAHLMWSGQADKSAQVRMARDQGELKLNLAIRDDHHHVEPENLKEGDCAIISINVPGQKGYWKWAVSDYNGKSFIHTLASPQGQHASVQPNIAFNNKSGHHYQIVIKEDAIGLKAKHYSTNLRFNLTLVDHDGQPKGVESFMHIAPVTEAAEPEPENWTRLVFLSE